MHKLFVVSDIHGYFTPFQEALDRAGFDPQNEEHLLVFCGDLFDRGSENLKVLQFFERTDRKIMIKGNHEDLLLEIFRRCRLEFYDFMNGTDRTIEEFFGRYAIDGSDHSVDFSGKTRVMDRIEQLFSEMRPFYETKHYIFVHGWLPIRFGAAGPYVPSDWREAGEEEWKEARALEWQQAYGKGLTLPGKTIVCGHRPASLGHMFDQMRFPDDEMPFHGDGLIAIDASTFRSGKVNVLVLEDELLTEESGCFDAGHFS